MFNLRLSHDEHIRQYSITYVDELGWEVRLIEDDRLRQQRYCRDWHRVERSMALFEREARGLEAAGWCRDLPSVATHEGRQ
jgi:hypothetical protein